MKILVTGANGQLGSELRRSGPVSGMDMLFHDIDTLDISDVQQLNAFCSEHQPAYIINCAAYTAVDKAEAEVQEANRMNHAAVKNLRVISDQLGCRVIHLSTDYVFDGLKNTPYTEDDPPAPANVYGLSKLMGEYELLTSERALIIRTSWLYSSFGNNFLKTILRCIDEGKEPGVVYDQVGTPTYARDLAEALISIIRSIESKKYPFIPGIYHYANEGVCSWYDFAHEIIDLYGIPCKIRPLRTSAYPLPARRPSYSVLAKEKIKTTYGLHIPYWKDSLKKCITEIKNNYGQ